MSRSSSTNSILLGASSVPLLETTNETKLDTPLTRNRILRLCAVGFFVNFVPSDAYLTRYLRENKGLSEQELNDHVWPWSTYATLLFFVPMAFLAETLGYRMTIFLGLVARELLRVIYIYCDGVIWMAISQVIHAAAMTAQTVYFAYAFMIFDEEHFQTVTSWIHGSYYLGYMFGCIMGAVIDDYLTVISDRVTFLFYLSWGFTTIALLCFFMLPKARREAPPSVVSMIRRVGIKTVLKDIKSSYSDPHVQIWSLWWLIVYGASAIYVNYYQNQFSNIDPNGSFGYVGAFFSLFSAIGSTIPSFMTDTLFKYSRITIVTTVSMMGAGIYLSTVFESSIYYSYSFTTAFMAFYAFQYSSASAIIGKCLPNARYALTNSSNSLLALILATIVQAGTKGLSTDGVLRVISYETLFLVFLIIVHYLVEVITSFYHPKPNKSEFNSFS